MLIERRKGKTLNSDSNQRRARGWERVAGRGKFVGERSHRTPGALRVKAKRIGVLEDVGQANVRGGTGARYQPDLKRTASTSVLIPNGGD